ncbi:TPA: restriction endonuclease subunit S [Aeromonas veronii]
MAEQIMQETAGKAIPAGYKQTEVGVIPEDWGVVCLGDIGQSLIGLTYSPKNVSDDGVLVLRSSNVQNGRLAYEDSVFVKMELPDRVMVKEGDILICVRNGSRQLIGKCALIDKDAQGFAFGAFMSVYRTEASGFVFYQFQSDVIQLQINETMGATINQITNRDLSGFRIMIPNSNLEQTAIANVLSDSDALIDALEQLIAKKQAIKSATMQQLLTGRTRLPTFALHPDGTPKGYKPSELGEIPEDWEVSALSAICDVRDGTHDSPRYKDNGIPLVTSKNIVGDVLDLKNVSLISPEDAFEINKRSKVDKGDIIMSMIGTVGSAVLLNDEPDFCIKNVALFKPKRAIGEFLVQLIHSKHFQDYLEDCMDGGIQKFVSLGTLRNMEIVLPSIEEQTAIATILSDMDNELQALTQKLEKARALKQGMMQQLLTGKTRLPLAAGA